MIPKKIGTVQTIAMDTGAIVAENKNAMTMLPPGDDVCQECAVDHPHDQPHNQQSFYYQYHFYSTHGRWPTWTDAMVHCTPAVQTAWKKELIAIMNKNHMQIPPDLLMVGPAQGR